MNVRLISLTQPCIEIEGVGKMSTEELIIYIARVSNPSNQENLTTAPKLIRYLIDNKHWSPFDLADMTVEVVTSRAIAQQILRHKSFYFQEFSQRYAKVSAMEPIQIRKQAVKNRQSSLEEFDPLVHLPNGAIVKASRAIEDTIVDLDYLYNQLIEEGVAKECARFILPLTTQTKLYFKGTVRSWIHYLQIRCDEHTQLEHRQIANRIKDIFKENFPNISEALEF